ncbi:MAG TPA: tripartite tricarboxylate transporter substrate binding protein [Ramlibacter sp.]|nr:tripartite tricarboxylate transporter substrate binding protein [Ramlibacter sp.]
MNVWIRVLVAIALCFGTCARAQSWPSKPVTLVVPYAPGGTNDIIARAVAVRMGASLGQPVLVVNKAGAGGNIGAQFVARAPADGHTVLVASSAILAISKWVYRQPGYDPDRDFAPVTLAGKVTNVLLVNPTVPANSVRELVRYARNQPRELAYASMGSGTSGHLSGEMFQMLSGIELQHVPYRGSSQALTDLLGGYVDMMFDNLPTALPFVRSGKLKALAVTTAQRSPLLPDVPTLAESGVRGFEAYSWFGFVVPAATPQAILDRLNAEFVSALSDTAVHTELTRMGIILTPGSRAEFARLIAEESRMWRLIAEKSRARAD